MTLQLFPSLPGLGWSVIKSRRHKNRIQTSISGRETRLIDQPYPITAWTLTYDFLRDKWDARSGNGLGAGYDELRGVMGLYDACHGTAIPFLFEDPTDNTIEGQQIGTGDGTTTLFQLVRTLPYGFAEPITAPTDIQGVFVNGDFVPPGTYTWDGDSGLMAITPAPDPGVAITVDFTYRFRCRFSDDTADFENFMYQLWTLKQIKIQTVLL